MRKAYAVLSKPDTREAINSFFLVIFRVWDTSIEPSVTPATIMGIMIGVVGIAI